MKILLLAIAALNLWAGWLPTNGNAVDFPSMACFVMAAVLAYGAGDTK